MATSDNQKRIEIVDLLRSIMYGDNDSLYSDTVDLGECIASLDGVPFEPEKNRLVVALKKLRASAPDAFAHVECLNDPYPKG